MANSKSKYSFSEGKETTLGLYFSAKDAFKEWDSDPENTSVLDVRTFEEYVLIGHAEMAVNIPLAFPAYSWDEGRGSYSVVGNDDFVTHVNDRFKKQDKILVMCRSGGRSAMATNMLAKDGYENVYNIFDGFEGDKVEDQNSVFLGKRMQNGWKNSAPWTYDLNPELVWLPSEAEVETLKNTLDL